MKDFSKKLLVPACVYFTVIAFFYAAVNYIVYGSGEGSGLDSLRMILFFVFSLIFATANVLFSSGSLPKVLRTLLHALLCGFGFWLCMILPNDIDSTSTKLMGMLIFYLAYAVIFLVFSAIRRSQSKKENLNSDYKSIISKDKDNK